MKSSEQTVCETVYEIVINQNAVDVWQIAGYAMEDKAKKFKEQGWGEVNSKITEGDVRCVLRAIIHTSIVKMQEERPA